jgi:hypothetical protein
MNFRINILRANFLKKMRNVDGGQTSLAKAANKLTALSKICTANLYAMQHHEERTLKYFKVLALGFNRRDKSLEKARTSIVFCC